MKTPESAHPARWWHPLEDGREPPHLQCDLCPRDCKLHDGQRGACFVRRNDGGQMVLTTYGRSSGFCIDPVEKKPLNHFHPGSAILSFGTAGCNLACKFCQNWDVSRSREMDTLMDAADPETLARAAERLGCRSMAYTYNEPLIFLEYAVETAKACRPRGIRSVAVTAGYMTAEPRQELFQWMDAANVDLKGFRDDFYQRFCGGRLQPVLDTLLYLRHETQVWLELTTLLIPGENDSSEEIEAMTRWVVGELGPDVPMHFTAFHPAWKMRSTPATPHATLTRARRIAMDNGVRYAYVGNVHDPQGESTYCHRCGQILVGRDGYVLSTWHLTADGCCERCGTPCAGVFEAGPGHWDGRRQSVRLASFSA